jgi:two-component system alkaline phosphatase synthesis response regulator PhoP
MSQGTILVVDDEANIVELVRMYLEKDGYTVIAAQDGRAALERIEADRPDLVVLDLMLPEIDGWEVCKQVRTISDLPILMLTARDDDIDKIVGLELGADDYMTKPFNPRELVARIRAILRRVGYVSRTAGETAIERGNVSIDVPRREVTVNGQPVDLRAKEFDLLHALVDNAGIVLSREKLLELVWGFDFLGQTRTVDVHVAHLRSRLAAAGSTLEIETVWGIGYKLIGE